MLDSTFVNIFCCNVKLKIYVSLILLLISVSYCGQKRTNSQIYTGISSEETLPEFDRPERLFSRKDYYKLNLERDARFKDHLLQPYAEKYNFYLSDKAPDDLPAGTESRPLKNGQSQETGFQIREFIRYSFKTVYNHEKILRNLLNRVYITGGLYRNEHPVTSTVIASEEHGCDLIVAPPVSLPETYSTGFRDSLYSCLRQVTGLSRQRWRQMATPFNYSRDAHLKVFGYENADYISRGFLARYGLLTGAATVSFEADWQQYLYYIHYRKAEMTTLAGLEKSYRNKFISLLWALSLLEPEVYFDQLEKLIIQSGHIPEVKLVRQKFQNGFLYRRVYPEAVFETDIISGWMLNSLYRLRHNHEILTNWGHESEFYRYRIRDGNLIRIARFSFDRTYHSVTALNNTYAAAVSIPDNIIDEADRQNRLIIFNLMTGAVTGDAYDNRYYNSLLRKDNLTLLTSRTTPAVADSAAVDTFSIVDGSPRKIASARVPGVTQIKLNSYLPESNEIVTTAPVDSPAIYLKKAGSFKTARTLSCPATATDPVAGRKRPVIIADSGFYFLCLFDMTGRRAPVKIDVGRRRAESIHNPLLFRDDTRALVFLRYSEADKTQPYNLTSDMVVVDLIRNRKLKVIKLPFETLNAVVTSDGSTIAVSGTHRESRHSQKKEARLYLVKTSLLP